jgi:hypothetical protein
VDWSILRNSAGYGLKLAEFVEWNHLLSFEFRLIALFFNFIIEKTWKNLAANKTAWMYRLAWHWTGGKGKLHFFGSRRLKVKLNAGTENFTYS